MKAPPDLPVEPVPIRALLLSLAALAVPVFGALAVPVTLGEYGALLWLLALIPGFLLAYYRGWRGAATALAFGMATLSVTQVVALLIELAIPDTLMGVVVGYVGIALGIGWLAELLHQQRQSAQALAYSDLLTRLPNRRRIRMSLENEFSAARRGRPLSIVLFDLDNFKDYNDRYGHPAGDEALAAFGEVLLKTTRQMNLTGRYGGEEFLAVLSDSDDDGALIFAERVRASLRAANLGDGPLTVSAGVASYHPGMTAPEELLAGADHALYQAKHEGRDCVRLFPRPSSDPAVEAPGSSDLAEGDGYPRPPEELGKTRPPITLLPHHTMRFGAGRLLLLAVEDDRLRDVLGTYLSREGFEVTEIPDAAATPSTLDLEHDVAVVWFQGAAVGLIATLKSHWPNAPVIALVGPEDARGAADARRRGADAHLFQPFSMPELKAELLAALDRRDHRLTAVGSSGDKAPAVPADAVQSNVLQGLKKLVDASEAKDSHRVGRSTYVAAYAVELARAMDPRGEIIDRHSLHLGAQLIDIGFLPLPDGILTKPAALTNSDWEHVREHPVIGHDMLAALLDDATALSIVRSHQERWDGQGYPDGLAGAAIPYGARIVAIADALEAITSKRAFRDPLTWDQALVTIKGAMGTRFDPDLVPPFDKVAPSLRNLGGETRSIGV